jgi:hypothetical protein
MAATLRTCAENTTSAARIAGILLFAPATAAVEQPRKSEDPPAVAGKLEPPLDVDALKARSLPSPARTISGSREAIWDVLADP